MTDAADYDVVLLAAGCSRRLAELTRDVPKSFLTVGGRRIIDRQLETLGALGFRSVIAVVGYRKEVFYREIGDRHRNIEIRYVESADYETTGHGWSLYLASDLWRQERRPLLLMHADLVYDPRILRNLIASESNDAIAVDEHFQIRTHDEIVVCGGGGRVTGLRKVTEKPRDVIGEVIGMNKWTPAVTEELFGFMKDFFARHGRNYNWEPVVDAFLPRTRRVIAPVPSAGLSWMNVNHPQDLLDASSIDASSFPIER